MLWILGAKTKISNDLLKSKIIICSIAIRVVIFAIPPRNAAL